MAGSVQSDMVVHDNKVARDKLADERQSYNHSELLDTLKYGTYLVLSGVYIIKHAQMVSPIIESSPVQVARNAMLSGLPHRIRAC